MHAYIKVCLYICLLYLKIVLAIRCERNNNWKKKVECTGCMQMTILIYNAEVGVCFSSWWFCAIR